MTALVVQKNAWYPAWRAPLDPFRAGPGMSDDDVGLDREREATFVNIGRQPSVYFSKQRGACTLTASPTAPPSGEPVR